MRLPSLCNTTFRMYDLAESVRKPRLFRSPFAAIGVDFQQVNT